MRRAPILLLAILALGMQQGDGALRVKAFVCTKVDRDYCARRSHVGYEPARIRIEVYLKQHPGNRAIGYGLDCEGFIVAESRGELTGTADPPILFVEHRDMSAGTCVAVAKLARADGTVIEAQSEPIRIVALQE